MRTAIILLCGVSLAGALLIAETAAGLTWTAPAGWVNKGPAPMRAATYTVGDAECVINFFGPGQGGPVDANMTRWKGQFTVNGAPAPGKVATKTIHGLTVNTLDIQGTYAGMGGPMMSPLAPQANTRMLAAIVEGPGGNIFVKLTGPVKTVTANAAKFDELLNSVHK
jgi:hypothetical protein